MGICCMTQGTQTGALWQSRKVVGGGGWERGWGGREHECAYGWFLLMYDRKPQNCVINLQQKINKQNGKKNSIYFSNNILSIFQDSTEDPTLQLVVMSS